LKRAIEYALAVIAVATFLGGGVAWVVSVETRVERALNVSGRLEAIEEMLRPLIVEHEVQKALEARRDPMTPVDVGKLRKKAEADTASQINWGRSRSRMMEQRR